MISAQNLVYSLQGRRLTDNVSLTFPGGEIVAILGPNGEQQRVQLARLLVQLWEPTPSPKWLFLDEPTSALDIHHQQHLFRLLRQLVHERQFNVCCILHDLNLAARYADRVVLMQKGKVIANGKPQDVLTQQALTMLYGADITVLKDPANHSPLIVLDH